MLDDVLGHLRCPHCGATLARRDATVACARGHAHDVARQGYVSLLAGSGGAGTGDTSDMVTAREAFLAAGHLDGLAAVVAEAARVAADRVPPPACVVDVGAGTGRYLARALDVLDDRVGVALDLSKPALRRAARAHPRIGAVAADTWQPLPLADATAAAVLCVFAPRNAPEIRRVLAPGGALVVAAPTAAHLAELVAPLGLVRVDARKRDRLAAALDPHLEPAGERRWERTMVLDRAAAREAVRMGPSAHHLDAATLDTRLDALPDPVEVTASVVVSTHRRPA